MSGDNTAQTEFELIAGEDGERAKRISSLIDDEIKVGVLIFLGARALTNGNMCRKTLHADETHVNEKSKVNDRPSGS